MRYVNIPVAGAQDLTLDNARRLSDALQHPDAGATFVHCVSSNRVGALFALKAALLEGSGLESALAAGRAAGLRTLEPAVRQILAATSAG
jgi:hypothetical protein